MFRVKNLGAADVELDIVAAEGFEGFVGRIRLGGDGLPTVLGPGEERSVEIKLDIPKDAVPGDYTGIVRVSSTDGAFSVDIPALVTVAGKDDKKAADPPAPTQVEPQPGTAGPSPPAEDPAPNDGVAPPEGDPPRAEIACRQRRILR